MLPKTSKNLRRNDTSMVGSEYPLVIALALKGGIGDSRRAIKTLTRWMGASERTVQNWLSAVRGGPAFGGAGEATRPQSMKRIWR